LEIVGDWKRRNTIAGLEHLQAAVYIPDVDRIAVSSQSGKLRFYDAERYVLVRTLDFGNEANTDNMRHDPKSKRLYVGYGAGARGAIAVVDPATMERIEEYKVGTHPESFELETTGPRIFVNLPGQGSIGVIDRTTGAVTKWRIPGHTNVHAMAWTNRANGCSQPLCSLGVSPWWTPDPAPSSPPYLAYLASTISGLMQSGSGSMRRARGLSTFSSRVTLTTTVQLLM
jgi:hypothetical protein